MMEIALNFFMLLTWSRETGLCCDLEDIAFFLHKFHLKAIGAFANNNIGTNVADGIAKARIVGRVVINERGKGVQSSTNVESSLAYLLFWNVEAAGNFGKLAA